MSKKRKNFHYHYAEQYETRRERRRTKRRFSAPPVALLFTLIMLGLFGMISVSFSAFVTNDISDPDKPAKNSLIASVRNHAVRENTDSDLVSRKADLAGVGAERDLAGTGWKIGGNGVKFYYLDTDNWGSALLNYWGGNVTQTDVTMTKIDNTNIFCYSFSNAIDNLSGFLFHKAAGDWTNKTGNDIGTNVTSNAWFFGSSDTVHTNFSTYPMYKAATVKNMISIDGGSTYTETSNERAITTISGYTLTSGATSASAVSSSTTSAVSSASINAAYGSTVTMSAAAGTGVTFKGFSTTQSTNGLPGGISDSTSATYTAKGYTGQYTHPDNDVYYAYYEVVPDCEISASSASLSLKVGEIKSVTISAENHASGNVTVTVPQAARNYIQVCATQNGTYSYSATLTGITNSATKNVYVKGIRPYSNATLTAACQQHTTIPSSTPATFTVSVSTPNLTVSDLTLEEAKSGTLTATVASGSPTPSSYQWSIASGDRITLGSSSTGSVDVTALKLTSNNNATAKVTVTATYSTGYSKTFTNAATVTVTASKYFLNGFGAASGTAGWGYSAWGNAPERRMVYNPSTSKYEVSLNFTGANVKSYPGGSDENGFKIRYNDTWYTGSYSGNSKLTRSDSGTAKSFSTTGGSNNNAGIEIDIAGTYLFAFDPTSGSEKLTVTYPANVTVNYHTNGGTLPTPDYTEETAGALYTGTYPYADGLAAASMPVASYTGYTFDGWYSDAECTASVTSIAASTAVYDLYAKWSISSISIRDNIDGTEIMTISGITMGADITETDITDAAAFINRNTALEARGYEFSSWSPALTNVTSSIIYAQYLPVTKAFDVSILPTNIISGAGTQNNPFVITFGSSIKVQASIIDPFEDDDKISYRWSLTENGTYVAGSTGTTYENDNIIATMPSKTSGYFDLYTKAYANDYNNQQLIGASTQSKPIWYKVESPLGNVTLNSSTDYQKIYKSTPVVDVTFDTNMYQYSSQDLDNTKVNDFTRYKVDFQEYSFDSYASLLENLLSITFANGAFDAPPITGIETVVVGSESVDNITEYGKLSGVHHFKYLLKRPAVPSGYEDDSSIEFRTVVGTNMSNNTRPLYLYNNGSSLAERRVMLFYVKSGSLLHQTAQRVSTTPEIYRFEIPTDADLQIQIAAIDTAKKYELPYYDFANNQIYYYENTNPDIPDTNAHCASKMSDFMSVNTAGSEIQTLYLSSVTFGTDASPGTMTVSTGDYTM